MPLKIYTSNVIISLLSAISYELLCQNRLKDAMFLLIGKSRNRF
jgi:hypothetical protein